MVHPNFAQQQVPRPSEWETPQLANFADFWAAPSALRDSISDRFRHVLLLFQYSERRPLIYFLRYIPDFVGLAEWEPHRLLGAGAFGLAGLWERKDAQGATQDEMVVKRVLKKPGSQWMCYRDSRGNRIESLLSEAVLQKLINQQKCGNVVHLRGYKYCTNDPLPGATQVTTRSTTRGGGGRPPRGPLASNSEYRFYMEYAPYGSLERLKRRYRAWSQWLPEAFLWHLFECLIHTVLAMMTRPADQTLAGRKRKWHDDAEIIHLDIKPDNIFLGYETPMDDYTVGGGENLPYPIVQLGDYGLAEVTHHEDTRNPSYLWDSGTKYYQTPEMLHYGIGFRFPPNGPYRPLVDPTGRVHDIVADEEDDDDPGFRFLVESNIWAIGKVMYDLVTLSESRTFREHWASTERTYVANNYQVIPDFQAEPFQWSTTDPSTANPYSRRLMETIGRCLEASITDRMDIQDLVDVVQREISALDHDRTSRDTDQPAGSVKRRRLYYSGNDINDMPLGTVNFPTTQHDYKVLMEDWTEDPSWRSLRLPAQKWQPHINVAAATRQPRTTRNRFNIRQGRIWFANPPPPPANTLRRSTRIRNRNANRP